jgi:ubiquinone/menaquinone biosynthesis C-methylase UbiE
MQQQVPNPAEGAVKEAFDKQSAFFDGLYSPNPIIQYKRDRVRELVLAYVQPGQRILELNAGTGEDALYFGHKGCLVHATDISAGMQSVLAAKVRRAGLQQVITQEICSFTQLASLQNKGPYDLVFSNFAGLNCTNQLDQVLLSLPALLKPGGRVVLTLMPGFCLWETCLALRGDFKTAFRRFFSRKGASAHLEGVYFKCWYYSPGYVTRTLRPGFNLLKLEGLCAVVPPSYLEHFPVRFPRAYAFLVGLERKWKSSWPWKMVGDYYIMALEKKN